MDLAQQEVLGAEAAARGLAPPAVPVSGTACPVSRAFSMCLEHSRACSRCGHVSSVAESTVMLSLDVPGEGGAAGGAPLPLTSLLRQHFSSEEVAKDCDSCGARSAPHTARHRVVRMPRVLVLHLKRFRAQIGADGAARLGKSAAPVQAPASLSLSEFAAGGARAAPLPAGPAAAACPARAFLATEKENLGPAPPRPEADPRTPEGAHVLRPRNRFAEAAPAGAGDAGAACQGPPAGPGAAGAATPAPAAAGKREGGAGGGAAPGPARAWLEEDTVARGGEGSRPGSAGGCPTGYRLTAIVRHIGASLEAGHFVADARRPSRAGGEEWVRYDDARVGGIGRGVPLEASETAYVAFYVHEGVEG